MDIKEALNIFTNVHEHVVVKNGLAYYSNYYMQSLITLRQYIDMNESSTITTLPNYILREFKKFDGTIRYDAVWWTKVDGYHVMSYATKQEAINKLTLMKEEDESIETY